MRIKQSVCYPIFRLKDASLDELFRLCAEIGYAAVELWSRGDDFEEVVEIAKQHNLAVASMVGHSSLPDGLNKRSNHDRIEDELKTSIDVAAKHGISGLICFSGNRQPFQTEIEAIEAVADGFRRVAPYADKMGVNLNLELLNSKVNHPGYQCDHTAWGVAVCERVDSPRVKLLFDIYHMQIMEGDLIRSIKDNGKYFGHYHTGGNPGRHEFDETQELNYSAICKAIADLGYQGVLSHEYTPTRDPLPTLEKMMQICDV